MTDYNAERVIRARETYQALSRLANDMGGKIAMETFVEEFLREHPTLQQQIGSLFLQSLLAMPERGDLRNEDIRNKVAKIREALGDEAHYVRLI